MLVYVTLECEANNKSTVAGWEGGRVESGKKLDGPCDLKQRKIK